MTAIVPTPKGRRLSIARNPSLKVSGAQNRWRLGYHSRPSDTICQRRERPQEQKLLACDHRAPIRQAREIANHMSDRYRIKHAAATRGPTLSAAARDGRQNHHTKPSGISAQTQGIYQKLGAPKSDANVKQVPPTVNSVPAATREMVWVDTTASPA